MRAEGRMAEEAAVVEGGEEQQEEEIQEVTPLPEMTEGAAAEE